MVISKTEEGCKGELFNRLVSVLQGEKVLKICFTTWIYLILLNCTLQMIKTVRLEKEMATHSNILAWRIPWTEEPGGL